MTSNPMQRKVRNSFLLGILVTVLIIVLIGTIVFFAIIKPKMDIQKEKEEQLYISAYRLKPGTYVESGDAITGDMVESVEIPVETEFTDFMISKIQDENGNVIDMGFEEGYKSKIALTEGTILTYSMLYQEEMSDSLRYVEFSMISMPSTVDIGNYVDIRIRLANGQDLIVISKKEVINLFGQTVGFNLTEEEMLILNSAIVESYIMTASQLHMTQYIEPGVQSAALYTYMPTAEVVNLINMDPNIVAEARTELAKLYSAAGVSNIREQLNNTANQYSGTKDKSIEEGIKAQIEAARRAREDYLSGLEGEITEEEEY